MKFTTEEIALCKKIAEKHRKEMVKGDWFIPRHGRTPIVLGENMFDIKPKEFHKRINNPELIHIPLWQISDCLEFLREKDSYIHLEYYGNKFQITAFAKDINSTIRGKGETPLEACLKAVLAIVEEPC